MEHHPGLLPALAGLIESAIRGDPESPRRWLSRSRCKLRRRCGASRSQKLVGQSLHKLGHSCQANRKTREGNPAPRSKRAIQIRQAAVKAALVAGEPAISVDAKKEFLLGSFSPSGRSISLRPTVGHPVIPMRDTDAHTGEARG